MLRIVVQVPGLLRSYTAGAAQIELEVAAVAGAAAVPLAAVLAALDARFPGLRFRIVDEQHGIRPHIKLFVDRVQAPNLQAAVRDGAELLIVGALSGG